MLFSTKELDMSDDVFVSFYRHQGTGNEYLVDYGSDSDALFRDIINLYSPDKTYYGAVEAGFHVEVMSPEEFASIEADRLVYSDLRVN